MRFIINNGEDKDVNMKYKNRLSELRGDISQEKFAKTIGLTQQNYWKYENGLQGMRSDLIERICKMFGCSAEWLLCLDNEPPKTSDFAEVRVYGAIAAGKPLEMLETDSTEPVRADVIAKYPHSFLLKVKGESMNNVLPNGCFALVDPCSDVERDMAPYAVCVNGNDATIKRVRKLNNGFELVPDSKDPTFISEMYNYNEAGTEEITIIGRVVYYVLPKNWEF